MSSILQQGPAARAIANSIAQQDEAALAIIVDEAYNKAYREFAVTPNIELLIVRNSVPTNAFGVGFIAAEKKYLNNPKNRNAISNAAYTTILNYFKEIKEAAAREAAAREAAARKAAESDSSYNNDVFNNNNISNESPPPSNNNKQQHPFLNENIPNESPPPSNNNKQQHPFLNKNIPNETQSSTMSPVHKKSKKGSGRRKRSDKRRTRRKHHTRKR